MLYIVKISRFSQQPLQGTKVPCSGHVEPYAQLMLKSCRFRRITQTLHLLNREALLHGCPYPFSYFCESIQFPHNSISCIDFHTIAVL